MKTRLIGFMLILLLFGCSNEEEGKKAESRSLEEQIIEIMAANKLKNKEIIDFDLKNNFIYVIFKNKHEYGNSHNPDLVIVKNDNGVLEWVAGPNDRTMSVSDFEADMLIFGRQGGPSVSIILPAEDENQKIKEVKVLGESAKSVAYVEYFGEDFSKQYCYWIAYTEEEPTHEDFEFIMQ